MHSDIASVRIFEFNDIEVVGMVMEAAYDMCGSGPAVVLVHGSMNSRKQWKKLNDVLEKDFTVIAVDLYGYGETPLPEDLQGHTMEAEVALIDATLDRLLGVGEPVHYVGHSYGGALGLCYASVNGERLSSLTLFEPMSNHLLEGDPSSLDDDGRRLIEDIRELAWAGRKDGAAELFVNYFMGEGTFPFLPDYARAALTADVDKMLIDYRTTVETGLTLEHYREIGAPVCLIAGRESRAISLRIFDILKGVIPGVSSLRVVGGHMAPVMNPDEVNRLIQDFLREHAKIA